MNIGKPGAYPLMHTYKVVAGKIDSHFTVMVETKNDWYSEMRYVYNNSYTLLDPNKSRYRSITFNNDIRSIMRDQLVAFRVTGKIGRADYLDVTKPALPFKADGSIEIDFSSYTIYSGIRRGLQSYVTIYVVLKDGTQVKVLDFIAE